jgi:hypothetical protein
MSATSMSFRHPGFRAAVGLVATFTLLLIFYPVVIWGLVRDRRSEGNYYDEDWQSGAVGKLVRWFGIYLGTGVGLIGLICLMTKFVPHMGTSPPHLWWIALVTYLVIGILTWVLTLYKENTTPYARADER